MVCTLTGLIGGIDEAGRGPLAGPVVSSCVVWHSLPDHPKKINDSKLLSPKQRSDLFPWIQQHAFKIGIGIATHEEIDKINILRASLLSMERALHNSGVEPNLVLIDGRFALQSYPHSRPVVKGDRKCFYIACASIVAKVTRDTIMNRYDLEYPQYNFRKNKGYPTKDHRLAIKQHGVSPIHRKTFKGVREFLGV
ncbi:MAG TPA: ribonuclease HII [Syntrophorhabdus sp.]|nr:ribonuclease HII [Syntrophorhabdus sp.]